MDYATTGGTATEGTDYTAASGTATITAGATSTTIEVTTLTDDFVEQNEQYVVNLSNALIGSRTLAITDSQGEGTINDDDTVTIEINDTSSDEASPATFTVTLGGTAETDITVDYATTGGTATEGTDYTAASGTATITAGATSTTIEVTTLTDDFVEQNEQYVVNLSNALIGSRTLAITDSQGEGTINDDDTVTIEINDTSSDEAID